MSNKTMFELVEGNLLEAEADALVNTVNTEGVMGKGVALQFAKKFPDMLAAYKAACKAGEVLPGGMHVFERGEMFQPRYIINFPTKRHWRSPSRMEDIEAGLQALVREIERLHIRSIALPPLGCGNGGLDWNEVFPRIKAALSPLRNVRVLVFPPKGAPSAEAIVHHTPRPAMNPSRAIVVKIWQQYFALGYQLTLLEIHKLLYFLQEAGEPLRLRFAKDTYGPYADNLRHLLHRFEGHFTLGFADGRNKPDTEITLQPGAVQEAETFLTGNADTSEPSLQRLNRVARLVEGFESPYGMELLATVHWVVTHDGAAQLEEVVAGVHNWNARKRKLMARGHIELAHERLAEHGWV
ncbi:MAG: macro domain-containing protein [Verrucomicrobia bacterium]|jgi:O-acetyl-ADP-ribose deacetylase (regulator of RNase III)|nr:macro domain-containing protein [Verrucomicrobiota bacterium]